MPILDPFQQPDPIEPGTNNTDLNTNETNTLYKTNSSHLSRGGMNTSR